MPGTESQGKFDEKFFADIWGPMCMRVDFTRLTNTFRGNLEFPYTSDELAHAL